MSTDQICAYCEHSQRWHTDDGKGLCGALGPGVGLGCGCPRFIANTDTETHEVTEQVLSEDKKRKLNIAETANAGIAEQVYAEAVAGRPPPDFAAWGGTHLPTDIIPPPPALPDLINYPPHYTAHPSGVECIQITEHMNFNLGNALKYIWRASLKGAQLDDLKKAAWYVNREIERLSK